MVHLFSYYGGKNRLGPKYPPPRYGTIVEPFAGAAGYSCRYPDRKVILFEKDPVVAAVLEYLIRATPEEIRALPLIPPGATVDEFNLTPEQKWTIGFLVNHGCASPCKRLSRWGKDSWEAGRMSFWGPKCRERLAQGVAQIKHWQVFNLSWENAQQVAIHGPATWFVDPPYQNAGKYYKHKTIDFPRLGEWCRSLPGQVIVCENEGADWLPFRVLCEQVGAAKAGASRKRSVEVIWTND